MSTYGLDGSSRGSSGKITRLIEQARKFKDDGNNHYGSKRYTKAISNYHRALLMLRSVTLGQPTVLSMLGREEEARPSGEIMATVRKLVADCNCNLAACLLQQKTVNYQRVVECCDLAIENQPGNAKAHFRKGMALYYDRNYDVALKSLLASKTLCEHDPEAGKPVEKYIAMCHKAMQQQDQKLRETYKHMFGNTSQATPTGPTDCV